MFSHNDLQKIKPFLQEFFEKTTFASEVEISSSEADATLFVSLKTDEPQIMIGEGGQTLMEIQHLLKVVLRKKLAPSSETVFHVDLDINNYKKKKKEYLKELARTTADEVALTKKEKILPPMPAYERRVVHMELADRTDIATESSGEEPERKIIIKPAAVI
jgi:spoIIIJ-associated protein